MTRQEANFKIARILEETEIDYAARAFRECAESHTDQRCGQIFCNYICYDYRSENPSHITRQILNFLFPKNPDPFFEESEVTLKRLGKMFSHILDKEYNVTPKTEKKCPDFTPKTKSNDRDRKQDG